MKLLALFPCGALVLACGAHEEVTPAIAILPGAAARAMALLGANDPSRVDPLGRAGLAGLVPADAGVVGAVLAEEDAGDASAADGALLMEAGRP
jgi:hypothetical protein